MQVILPYMSCICRPSHILSISKSYFYTNKHISLLLQDEQTTNSNYHSNIHLIFFDLVNELARILCDAEYLKFDLAKEICSFMASNIHNIQLFSENSLKKMLSCEIPFLVQLYLLSFTTWLDNSLLRELVAASENGAAIKLVKKFDSIFLYDHHITSYPLPTPSQLMIPLDDSDYTVVATMHSKSLKETTLKQVKDTKMLLVDRWQITEHSIQLIAVQAQFDYLYWLIPKTVAPLVTHSDVMLKDGIMTFVFPDTFFSDDHDSVIRKLAVGPFSFLVSCSQDNEMVCTYLNFIVVF